MSGMGWAWHNLWPFAKTWEGYLVAALSFLLAIFYGQKKLLETYRWCMYELFDRRVENYLLDSFGPEVLTMHGPRRWPIPRSIADISKATGLPEWRVLPSLARLLSLRRTVARDGDNWKAAGRG